MAARLRFWLMENLWRCSINERDFDRIITRAQKYKYSSMSYVGFDEIRNAEILRDCDELILLCDSSKEPAMLYFAANDFNAVVKLIADMPGKLRIHFVPKEYAIALSNIGFIEWGEFLDFWNTDLAKTAAQCECEGEIEYLRSDECDEASNLTKKCELQSRGFEGVQIMAVSEWLADGKVIVCRKDAAIAGLCSVSIYNEGTTLWIRVIAVDPAYQGHGIGKELMTQAIQYGIQNGAVKGFLAADVLNLNAIGLFNKFGFFAKDSAGELQMVRE